MSQNTTPVVEVKSTTLTRERDYKGTVYGEQTAAIHNGGDFPLPIKLNVRKGFEYPPGRYVIDPRSFTTDEYGNLKLSRVQLLPLGGTSAKAA